MKKMNKKGFTIVELVIVIAIIAILAAVLIPTFASLIKKANVSKDTQLVRNLNTAVISDAAINGKHATMQAALDAAFEAGYDVTKIVASAPENEILWDQTNDVFCYLNNGTVEYIPNSAETQLTAGDYHLWKIYNEAPTTQTYSIYWNVNSTTIPTLTVGFDAGKTTGITTINYTRGDSDPAREVIIRTNGEGTNLTVSALNDTVHHYDYLDDLTVTKVAPLSYHEHGTVRKNASIAQGHFVVEEGASVPTIVVTSESTGKVTVDVKSEEKSSVVATNSAVAEELATSVTGTENKQATAVNIEDLNRFAGGLGTEASPFIIDNEVQLINISDYTSAIYTEAKPYFFKLHSDITITTTSNVIIDGFFSGGFDGNNHKIYFNSSLTNQYLFKILYDASVKDMNIVAGENIFTLANCAAKSITIDNVDIVQPEYCNSMGPLGSNQALYVTYPGYIVHNGNLALYGEMSIDIKNCDINVDISGTEYNALFFGYGIRGTATANIIDCSYTGTYIGSKVSPIGGNGDAASGTFSQTINITNFVNYGTIAGTSGCPAKNRAAEVNTTSQFENLAPKVTLNEKNCTWGNIVYLTDSNLAISCNDTGLSITEASISNARYEIRITGGKRMVLDENGNYLSENSSYTFKVNAANLQTILKPGYMVTDSQFESLGLEITESIIDSQSINTKDTFKYILASDGNYYYIFTFNQKYLINENGSYLFGSFDKTSNTVTGMPVPTREATVYAYNDDILIATANCEFVK